MPEVKIEIGGRAFEVACQAGEEPFLHSAAKMLDEEAAVLAAQIGRIPEARMLLMAGLMLADKTANLQDRLAQAEADLAELRGTPAPEAQRVEVPVVPDAVIDTLAEIAARAEALADTFDRAEAS
ncbi:cell division protein ZapA [Roseovarius autotrophicus]|uniref:cell division protein ZapA n=1 Tax=Roseovarius autotrophicus TaxID=2824121 RepID=UPI001B37331B|nr:cell division protein ZapA [Roseovarius autotrophicus]